MAEGEAVIARAKDEGRALLEQVQEARKRVMADLAGRRRALSIQIEQLRAARDEMAASVQGVRESVDGILGQLERSDDDARAAALAAGDQARLHLPKDARTRRTGDGGERRSGRTATAGGDPAPGRRGALGRRAVRPDPGRPPTSRDEAADRAAADGAAVHDADGEAAAGRGRRDAEAEAAEPRPRKPRDPTQALIARRDELLSPVSAQLSRHIKRALGDDQNRLLDVLRSTPNMGGEALLGPEDLHLSTFIVGRPGSPGEPSRAGNGVRRRRRPGPIPTRAGRRAGAAGLARTVVTMLRRRIADGTDAGEEVAERVGAAFREWRGERIERLVGDFAVQAFSAGVAAAITDGGLVRWVLTSPNGCSDCDDNALAGAVPVAEDFPPATPTHRPIRAVAAW